MSLAEQIEEDVSIFFDLADMATEHTIKMAGDSSPRNVAVVIDNDQMRLNELKSGGTHSGDLMFFAREADLAGIIPNSMISFDGIPYQVTDVSGDDVLQITLSAGMGGF